MFLFIMKNGGKCFYVYDEKFKILSQKKKSGKYFYVYDEKFKAYL